MIVIKYSQLAASVKIEIYKKKPVLEDHNQDLKLIGQGRSAFVFKINNTELALKVFFPNQESTALEEAQIYQKLQGVHHYPALYDYGYNYLVIDCIKGNTLFQCLQKGIFISEDKIMEIDSALKLAKEKGLNPSDIHLKNIIITSNQEIKVIDVARFRQEKIDKQWDDLRKAYFQLYKNRYFPKRLPTFILDLIADIYKRRYLTIFFRVLFLKGKYS